MKSKLIKKIGLTFFLKVTSAIVMFILNFYLARKLGINDAGVIFSFLGLIALFSGFSRFGLDVFIVKTMATGNDNKIKTYKEGRLIIITSGLLFGFMLDLLVKYKFDVSFEYFYMSLPFAIVALSLTIYNAYVMQGFNKQAHFILFSGLVLNLLFLMAVSIFHTRISSVEDYFGSYILVIFLSYFLSQVFTSRELKKIERLGSDDYNITFESIIDLIFKLKYFLSIAMVTVLSQWVGTAMLTFFSFSDDVARFNMALRTAMVVSMLSVAINAIYTPRFAKFYSQGKNNQILNELKLYSKTISLIVLPLFFILFLFSQSLMNVFGEGFSNSYIEFRLLLVAQVFNVLLGPLGPVLQVSNNEKTYNRVLLYMTLVTLIISPFVCLYFGSVGMATVVMTSIILRNVICGFYVKKAINPC